MFPLPTFSRPQHGFLTQIIRKVLFHIRICHQNLSREKPRQRARWQLKSYMRVPIALFQQYNCLRTSFVCRFTLLQKFFFIVTIFIKNMIDQIYHVSENGMKFSSFRRSPWTHSKNSSKDEADIFLSSWNAPFCCHSVSLGCTQNLLFLQVVVTG